MLDSYKKTDGEHYFAAANTYTGFKSYFDEIFSPKYCDKVYILKGGPGCGKSTFMKKAGALCETLGFSPIYFHCSSDPHSLDGIIIKEKRIAIVDGTNPHAFEPTLAGAREEIINLGIAWDTYALYQNKDVLYDISNEKSILYSQAYKLLYLKKCVFDCINNLLLPHILYEKIEKSACRLIKSLFKNAKKGSFDACTYITNAISCAGESRLFTFENKADYCVFLKPSNANDIIISLYMKALLKEADKYSPNVCISYSPFDPSQIDGLYFTDIGTSVTVFDESAVEKCDRALKRCKIINLCRFIDNDGMKKTKRERKLYLSLSNSIFEKALSKLNNAGKLHAKLEEIYGSCTDYSKVEQQTLKHLGKIFKG